VAAPNISQHTNDSEIMLVGNLRIFCNGFLHILTKLTQMFHGLGPLTSSNSDLTAETMNPFRHFGRTPWTGDLLIPRPVPTQDSTTQMQTYIPASGRI